MSRSESRPQRPPAADRGAPHSPSELQSPQQEYGTHLFLWSSFLTWRSCAEPAGGQYTLHFPLIDTSLSVVRQSL